MKSPRGFIALMSALIISAVLLVVIITANFTSFYTRSVVLDAEFKGRSVAAANACAGEALLNIAANPTYVGGTKLLINSLDSCRVGVVTGSTQKTFKVQATSSKAVTNLLVVVNSDTLATINWQEVPVY